MTSYAPTFKPNPNSVRDVCNLVSKSVWHGTPPSDDYAFNAERLLFMTAAHESAGFLYRRQLGDWEWDEGAFGLWQVEWGSMESSVKWLLHHPETFDRITTLWEANGFQKLAGDATILKWFLVTQPQKPEGDLIGCTMARVHYLRRPGKLPSTPGGMAAYAKSQYNTYLGKATREDYLKAFVDWAYPKGE